MRVPGALWVAALLAWVLWATPTRAKTNEPLFAVNAFDHLPNRLLYFEESEVVLFHDMTDNNVYRSDDGGNTWARVDAIPTGEAFELVMHQYDAERAYILTEGIQHFRTSDRGETWDMFLTDAHMSLYRSEVLRFNADDPDRIIFNGMDCHGLLCEELAMYTTDGFDTAAHFLRGNTADCWWAKSSPLFTTSSAELDRSRILCIVGDPFSPFRQDQRLLVSDNFFEAETADGRINEWEPNLDTDKPVQGVLKIAVVKQYLLAATTSMNTDELALFVSDDSTRWHRAVFPVNHRLVQEAYTVLESTEYSIQIDVMTTRPSNPMGVMFTSNSNGTYFTENIQHTNRNRIGRVDFEKIANIQGIFLVNKVANWEDVEQSIDIEKQIVSEITFDDGRTFEPVTAADERIHLHSVTDLNNLGRVFSSPAPGLVMGVGNTGTYLRDYWDGSLFVSDDAGKTWTLALDGPHKYEFGDQGSVLVAVRDSRNFDVADISYSLDHGQHWATVALPDDLSLKPAFLTTTQDSAGLKFILVGETEQSPQWQVIAIDFDGLHEATCTQADMEEWYARVDEEKQPTCLMGHTQRFHRRKKNAECFLKKAFQEPEVVTTDCECTDLDYECDYNFARDASRTECVSQTAVAAPEGACSADDPDGTFMGPSGWRKIPGNTCRSARDEPKERLKEWRCIDALRPPSAPATGLIAQTETVFDGDWSGLEKIYLERGVSSSTDDETVIVWPRGSPDGDITITHDHGKTWVTPPDLMVEDILYIQPHLYFKDVVFFITPTARVFYTIDRGLHFHSFLAPYAPDIEYGRLARVPLHFHPDSKDWLLWTGTKCDSFMECYPVVSYSKDRGDHWETAARYASHCEFTGSSAFRYPERKEEQIICLQKTREDDEPDNPSKLVVSNDWFDTQIDVMPKVREFATMAEFIVAATEHPERSSLAALASLDGKTFAEAHFPANFEVPHQRAYTVLDSSTHAVNLFVATETTSGREMGSILKSNSNGTSYVLSVAAVNCDAQEYVDFEKVQGLEGVALVNVVANRDDAGAPKKLQTRITHNDGAEWAYLTPPASDVDGKPLGCSGAGSEDCALHIHGYTERIHGGQTESSEGAVGLVFGWGNVGPTLGSLSEADTYMSSDAGISWRQVRKGRYMWSLGDQGSIIVLVQTTPAGGDMTNEIIYSLDGGVSWEDPYQFSDEKERVIHITTLRSGGSRNFLLWTKTSSGKYKAINLDFSGFSDRMCKHDENNPAASDYDIWSPAHPLQPNGCLFGHESQYLRKKTGRNCYNDFKMRAFYGELNCSCTRQDFECNYNYELDSHGTCRLVEGLQPIAPEAWCREHPEAMEYWEVTPYRRIPLTTCTGGKELDKVSAPHPCPGHQDEFDRAHPGMSGVAIFFAVTLPIAAAAAVGWWVWRNWSGKFGQIRLGEHGGGGGLLDSDQPWVRYPVILVSAVVAVIGALPLVAAGLWRTARGAADRLGVSGSGRAAWSRLGGSGSGPRTFTTRDSFARSRGDYAIVDEDEGELLGEDSDEEV